MDHVMRIFFVVTLLLCTTVAWGEEKSDAALIGCWRFDSGISYLADGREIAAKTKCTAEYGKNRITSRCIGENGSFIITYSYRISSPGIYEAEMLTHPGMPSAVGSRRLFEYEIKNNELHLTTYPQTNKPAPLNAAVKFVSRSTRDAKSCQP